MYAAAGGASLASRQARKKQAQQNTKNKATNQLILREKLAAKAASTPTKSKAFHQLPASYLRAPHQHHRKLSAGYTSIPGSDQQHPHHKFAFGEQPCTSGTAHGHGPPHPAIGHHAHHHHHHHHHHQHAGGAAAAAAAVGSPHAASGICHVHGAGAHGAGGLPTASGASFPPMPRATGFREYDKLVRRQQLTKSATATLPLVSQAQSPPDTPTLGFPGPDHHHGHGQQQQHHQHHELTQQQQQQLLQQQQQHQHQQHPNHHFYHYSQQPLIPGTKRGSVPVAPSTSVAKETDADALLTQPLMLQIPNDPIIITPATPQATPPGRLALKPLALTDDEEAVPLTSPTPGALERKCSVYRGRKLDPYEEQFYNTTTISGTAQHQYQPDDVFFPPTGPGTGVPNGGGGHSTTTTTPGHQQTKWDADYYCCECDHRQYGVCTCDQFECAQGRAAWLERGRRCSVQETPASCHRRWVKRNRIQDSSLGGSSDDEDLLGVLRGPSSFANAFLYVGLGTIAIGLVIAFVGTGEKGFKTVELRLIGPSLIGLGLFCCILRILFCICPSHCISSSRRAREKKNAKIDADHRTSLLRGDSKRVSIARGPHIPPQIYPKSIVKAKTYEGVEALRQIATTSLFLQNEQKVSSNRIVPIIKEPEKLEEPPLELKRIEPTGRPDNASIVSISDGEDDSHRRPHPASQRTDTQVIDLTGDDNDDEAQDQDEQSHSPNSSSGGTSSHQRKDSKLRRQRTSVNQQQKPGTARELQSSAYGGGGVVTATGHDTTSGSLLMETSLMIIGPTPISSPTKSMPVPQQQSHPPSTVVSTSAVPSSSSLAVPSMPANGSAVPVLGTTSLGGAKPGMAHPVSTTTSSSSSSATTTLGGNLLSLPSTSQGTSFGSTPLPGQLSPLPSTSYLSSALAGGYRTAASSSTSPLPGFIASPHFPHHHHHNISSSSTSNSSSSGGTSNYIFSSPPPPPFTQHEPITRGTNTITTASPLLHPAPTTVVNTTKTEPELVLSPAKLGQ
ncbi:uncharacterized protein LOC125948031 isoform X2 [Anopheles darlingi]|uniref:uncharacterized protein LOC125948031 isoform X2 n=1 Tax=Anopheles darlingi TaxID=43151 RepID=UPI002100675F|nr:uncharacterized protein LOC125948031 isoform X2 [Anopheles darlingi]